MKLKKITKENYKEVCLLLWERLSKRKYKRSVHENAIDFKNRHLRALGYGEASIGCPLCSLHHDREDDNCPLGVCVLFRRPCTAGDHPYAIWHHNMTYRYYNDPKLARDFYKMLKEIL